MKRRNFLALSFATGLSTIFANEFGLPLSNEAFAAAKAMPRRKKILKIFLRGGADVLSILPPKIVRGQSPLNNLRDSSYILGGDHVFTSRRFPFAFHNGLLPIKSLIDSGEVAIVTHTASMNETRSHFHQMDLIESGSLSNLLSMGYLARAGAVLDARDTKYGSRAVALGGALPYSLKGSGAVLVNTSADINGAIEAHFKNSPTRRVIANSPIDRSQRLEQLKRFQNCEASQQCTTIDKAKNKYQALTEAGEGLAAVSDSLPEFQRHMKLAAQVMSSDFSPQIVTIDYGGWDTHFEANPQTGSLKTLIETLGSELAAFKSTVGDQWNDIVVVVMSEFGRTVKTNQSFGTDHGAGSMMMILGGQVNSAHVSEPWDLSKFEDIAGEIPAAQIASSSALVRNVDYRLIMAEILHRHLGVAPTNDIFPDFRLGTYKNVLKAS